MTNSGLKREMNQDVFYTHKFSEQVGFAVVCDGMGGQSAGHIASEMVCSIVTKYLIEKRPIFDLCINQEHCDEKLEKDIYNIILNAINQANIQVFTRANVEPGYYGMGTTVVIAVVFCNMAYVANIGDSRAYILNCNKKLSQLTKDHSLVQELFEQGKIKKDEILNHPHKNMITRAVGVNVSVDIDIKKYNILKGEKILLCSDGLTNMVDDTTIEKTIASNSVADSCAKLIDLANKAGGFDNITVAIIE